MALAGDGIEATPLEIAALMVLVNALTYVLAAGVPPRAAESPRHDAREVCIAARRTGHRAAAVALTRVPAVSRARAQH